MLAAPSSNLPANDEGLMVGVAGIPFPFYNDGAKWIPYDWGANQFKPVAGRYYGPPCNTSAGSAMTTGALRVAPFFLPYRWTFDRISVFVNTIVAATLIRSCIYRDNGSGYPGALEFDPGSNHDGNVVNEQAITISKTLEPGLYWFGGRYSGAPNLRTMNNQQNPWTYFTGVEAASAFTSLALQAFATTPGTAFPALPDPFPAGATGTGTVGAVKVRAA